MEIYTAYSVSDQPKRNIELCHRHDNAVPVTADMADTSAVEDLIKKADVVIRSVLILSLPAVSSVDDLFQPAACRFSSDSCGTLCQAPSTPSHCVVHLSGDGGSP